MEVASGSSTRHEFTSLDGVIDAPTWTFDYGFDPKMVEALTRPPRYRWRRASPTKTVWSTWPIGGRHRASSTFTERSPAGSEQRDPRKAGEPREW